MSKLLRANFFRLRRSWPLLLCMIGAFALSSVSMLGIARSSSETYALDNAILQFFPFLPILHAAFISLFLGVEYQDGTLRNKLIAGHGRAAVYFSSLIAAMAGCMAILLAWLLSAAVGAACFGWFRTPLPGLLLSAAVILLLTAAIAAILTLLAMLTPNRAAAAVVSILLIFGLIIAGSMLYNALSEPEMFSGAIVTANGFTVGDPEPNPNYISGTLRAVYQFLVSALPTGQAILLANEELTQPVLSLCCSAGIVILTSLTGAAIFRKKDLK